MSQEDLISVETSRQGAVITVALNRPKQHNALTPALTEALASQFQDISRQQGIRVVILTGNGASFCAGADLNHMRAAADYSFDDNLAGAKALSDLMSSIDQCPKPVIGRVNGSAIGGGVGLACCCDITIAVESAIFGFSEVRLGLVPAVISPFVLAKIGRSKARRLFLTGERFDASHAKTIGLIDELGVDEPALDEIVDTVTERLLRAAPGALSEAKQLIRRVADGPAVGVLDYTAQLIAERRASQEGREGMGAFLAKRKPYWQDV